MDEIRKVYDQLEGYAGGFESCFSLGVLIDSTNQYLGLTSNEDGYDNTTSDICSELGTGRTKGSSAPRITSGTRVAAP